MYFGLPSLLKSIDLSNNYKIGGDHITRMYTYQKEFEELVALLLSLNPSTSGKKYVFWKEFDDYVAFNKIDKQTSYQEIINNCRRSTLIMKILCQYLEDNYPHPIPEVLFFPCSGNEGGYTVELANKWLMDCLSGESFLKRNREYFSTDDVKVFLKCDSELIKNSLIYENDGTKERHIIFRSLIKYYFLSKLSLGEYWQSSQLDEIIKTFIHKFENCFTNSIVINFLLFAYNDIKNIPDRDEIQDICDYLKSVFINNQQNFSFKRRTWQSLKRLSDEWHEMLYEQEREKEEQEREKELNTVWKRFSINDFSYTMQDKEWTINQITDGKELYKEGKYMNHCVYTYRDSCIDGKCAIFSLRCRDGSGIIGDKSATIEITNDKNISQARGRFNKELNIETKDIIKKWAKENGINTNNYLNENDEVIDDDVFYEEI
jgi:hypothetical protein